MTGAFECNEYQDVYLTPVDLEHASLETALRPGETEVSDLKMVAWDEFESAVLRQDTVTQYCWLPHHFCCTSGVDVRVLDLMGLQGYTPHATEYIAALGRVLRNLPPALTSSEDYKCGAWARA